MYYYKPISTKKYNYYNFCTSRIWSASTTLTIKMLEVLSLIVQHSSKSNREFTSIVIKLALEKIIPLVASNCYPPTVSALYHLLYRYNCKYKLTFFFFMI